MRLAHFYSKPVQSHIAKVMNDQVQISDGLNNIFSHRDSFIVIGLTGRTGSGCTTVADLLSNGSFDMELYELSNPLSNEDRKEQIIREWLKENWAPFQKIQVSHVIQLFAISDLHLCFENFITKYAESVKIEDLTTIINPHIGSARSAMSALTAIKNASPETIDSAYRFIFEVLPTLSKEIKDLLNKDGKKYYTAIFQKLGDNIRRSGNPLSESIDPSSLLTLPETTARIIKLARSRNKRHQKNKNYFVIDALRHPFEIRYLRERISPFYALAVTTDDSDRKARLHQNSFIPAEITRLDEKEYPSEIKDIKKKPQGYAGFVSQDIQACLSISDIYISNLGLPAANDFRSVAQQVCRYIALMQHPGLITPTNIERCMHTAFSAKINSGCISRQVGAVITDANYSIKAVGWNDVPKGQVPCLLRNTSYAVSKRVDGTAYSKYEKSDEFLKVFSVEN